MNFICKMSHYMILNFNFEINSKNSLILKKIIHILNRRKHITKMMHKTKLK